MRIHTIAGSLLMLSFGVSCATKPAPAGNTGGNAQATGGGSTLPDMPTIPKDARWTILCASLGMQNHAEFARSLKNSLAGASGLKDWYIVRSANHTTLYYGFYKAIDDKIDAREAARAAEDRRRIRALVDSRTAQRMFPQAIHVALESADPAAPPEWNLVNAKGFYTLQVAILKDDPDRKLKAVEAVREARAQGHDAYYYHGPTSSSVCVGTWPDSAVRVQAEGTAQHPNSVVVTLPPSMAPNAGMTPDGRPIEVIQQKVEIVDASLMAVMKAFPYTIFNGIEARKMRNPQTGQERWVRSPSRIVRIPGVDGAGRDPIGTSDDATPGQPPANAGAPIAQPPAVAPPPVNPWGASDRKPTGGKLRSLGE